MSTMSGYDRDDLNISPSTAELLGHIDSQDDGDIIAQALETAVLALVDITGRDPLRPTVARPAKLASRAVERVLSILEETETETK
mgnify:CR=1 FL=1